MFVTRGLVHVLDDDELAGVLAHEAGHLRAAGRPPPSAAFDGAAGFPGSEEHADDEGRWLLKRSEIPEDSLASALNKVRNAPSISSFVRAALDARIRRLTLAADSIPAGTELLADVPTGH